MLSIATLFVPTALALASAPQIATPAAAEPKRQVLAIRGGRIFDGTGSKTRALGTLVIEHGKVRDLLEPGAPAPAGAVVVDAEGCTVLPGLFDLHVHLGVPGAPIGTLVSISAEQNLASHLYCGVTSVASLHDDEKTIFALRDASLESAEMARLYAAGAAFTVPKGHGTQFGIPANEVTDVASVRTRSASLLPRHPDLIKAIVEHGDWGGLPGLPTLSDDVLKEISARSRAAGLPLFVHVWKRDEALLAARSGARALAHGVFLDDVDAELLEAMREHHTAYVPTLSVVVASARSLVDRRPFEGDLARGALDADLFAALNDPDRKASLAWSPMARLGDGAERRALANLKAVFDAGLEVGVGTDAGNPLVPHGPSLAFEVSLLVEAGLPEERALLAATLGSARILGVAERFGSLEPGKVADVLIVRGDPCSQIGDLARVEHVIKAGVLVDRGAIAKRNADSARAARTFIAGEGVPAECDGFEDGDLDCPWGGSWTAWSDAVAPNGASKAELSISAVDQAKALRVGGKVAEGFNWGAWAGAMLQLDARNKRLIDVSGFRGLRLRVRGTERPYTLTVQSAAVKDYDNFTAPVRIGPQWSEVEIPFANLTQMGFGRKVTWTGTDITGLNLDARNLFGQTAVHGGFEFEIDWIRLF